MSNQHCCKHKAEMGEYKNYITNEPFQRQQIKITYYKLFIDVYNFSPTEAKEMKAKVSFYRRHFL